MSSRHASGRNVSHAASALGPSKQVATSKPDRVRNSPIDSAESRLSSTTRTRYCLPGIGTPRKNSHKNTRKSYAGVAGGDHRFPARPATLSRAPLGTDPTVAKPGWWEVFKGK